MQCNIYDIMIYGKENRNKNRKMLKGKQKSENLKGNKNRKMLKENKN